MIATGDRFGACLETYGTVLCLAITVWRLEAYLFLVVMPIYDCWNEDLWQHSPPHPLAMGLYHEPRNKKEITTIYLRHESTAIHVEDCNQG